MSQALFQIDEAALRKAFMLGLAQNPLDLPDILAPVGAEGDPKAKALAALALIGQRARFERPPEAPADLGQVEAALAVHQDARPPVSSPVRHALRRMLASAPADIKATAFRIALWRLAERGLRLHPFDLPDLKSEMQAGGMPLRPAEHAFLALAQSFAKPKAASADDLGPISAENWTQFPPAARAAFIQANRAKDADGARALVEACFASEPAAIRADLLQGLRTGLTGGDVPFLEKCASDRSQQVHDVASTLLGLIEGTPAFEARLTFLVESLSIKHTGLLRRKTIALKKAQAKLAKEGFEGIGLTQLAARLDMTAEALIEAVDADDAVFGAALIACAITSGRSDQAAALAARLNAIDFVAIGLKPDGTPPDVLDALTARFIGLCSESGAPSSAQFVALANAWKGALSAEHAQSLVGGKIVSRLLADFAEAEPVKTRVLLRTLDAIALCLPAPAAQPFRDRLAFLPPGAATFALRFLDFVEALYRESESEQKGGHS